jgi:hypothetical protein
MRASEFIPEHELVWGRSNVTTRRSKPKLRWRCTTGQRAGRVVSNVADCDKPLNVAKRAKMKRTRANTKIQQARRSSRTKNINTGSRLIAQLNKPKRR